MIIFGPPNAIDFNRPNMIILNLSSMMEGFERVSILPSFVCQPGTEQVFDNMYAAYILNNDIIFYEFMKIMIPVYNGNDVYVIVSEMFDYVTESLQKFILARYGIFCSNVYSLEDWDVVTNSSFDINGVYNIDIDKERFIGVFIDVNGVKTYNQMNNMMNGEKTEG